ncbi:hypothetical protein GCM10009077_16020 [Roseibium denhamense]
MKLDSDHHAILEERGAVADEIGLQLQLFVCLGVHEYQHVFLGEEILKVFLFKTNPLDLVFGAKTLVQFAAVDKVFHFNLSERATFSRLNVLDLYDGPQGVLMLEHVARLDFVSVDFHGTTDFTSCLDLSNAEAV